MEPVMHYVCYVKKKVLILKQFYSVYIFYILYFLNKSIFLLLQIRVPYKQL